MTVSLISVSVGVVISAAVPPSCLYVSAAEEARLGAEYLLRGHRVGMDELLSGRHMDDWARAMALLDPRPAKVLVSVGMGSGLGLARWLGHWRAELGICETTW